MIHSENRMWGKQVMCLWSSPLAGVGWWRPPTLHESHGAPRCQAAVLWTISGGNLQLGWKKQAPRYPTSPACLGKGGQLHGEAKCGQTTRAWGFWARDPGEELTPNTLTRAALRENSQCSVGEHLDSWSGVTEPKLELSIRPHESTWLRLKPESCSLTPWFPILSTELFPTQRRAERCRAVEFYERKDPSQIPSRLEAFDTLRVLHIQKFSFYKLPSWPCSHILFSADDFAWQLLLFVEVVRHSVTFATKSTHSAFLSPVTKDL